MATNIIITCARLIQEPVYIKLKIEVNITPHIKKKEQSIA
jgi:hypothetical protein